MDWLVNGAVTLLATTAGGVLALLGVRMQTRSDRAARAEEAVRQAERDRERDRVLLERDRVQALRRLVPQLVGSAFLVAEDGLDRVEDGRRMMPLLTELLMWLEPDEWPIGRIAEAVFSSAFMPDGAYAFDRVLFGQHLINAWFLGTASVDDVRESWEHRWQEKLEPFTVEIGDA